MWSRGKGLAAALSVAIMVAMLPSCGGGGGSPTNPAPVPTPTPGPVRNTLPTLFFSGLARGQAQAFTLTISPTAGVAEIVSDWTFSTNDIDIFVTSTNCTTTRYNDLFNQVGSCGSIARGTSVSKPERLTTGSLAPATYKVYVGSSGLSSSSEAGSISITIVR